jgi:hypothetical protein
MAPKQGAQIAPAGPRIPAPATVSVHLGVPPAHAFPGLRRKDDGGRRHAHASSCSTVRYRGDRLRQPTARAATTHHSTTTR